MIDSFSGVKSLSRSVMGGLPAALSNASRLCCDTSSSHYWKTTLRLMRNASNSWSSKTVQDQSGHLQEDHEQANTIWQRGLCRWRMLPYIYPHHACSPADW